MRFTVIIDYIADNFLFEITDLIDQLCLIYSFVMIQAHLKRMKMMLENAFDGELGEIQQILQEVYCLMTIS